MKSFLITISKRLLRMALDKALERGLPEIYKRLDAEMPALTLSNASPLKVEDAIANAITSTTRKPASASQIAAVIGLYDPVKAAFNYLSSIK